MNYWGWLLTKEEPFNAAVPLKATGAANLKSPTGACPKGIPKYSETCEAFEAVCPLTGPLDVWTVCPTVQFVCLCSMLWKTLAEAHPAPAIASKTEAFILTTASVGEVQWRRAKNRKRKEGNEARYKRGWPMGEPNLYVRIMLFWIWNAAPRLGTNGLAGNGRHVEAINLSKSDRFSASVVWIKAVPR